MSGWHSRIAFAAALAGVLAVASPALAQQSEEGGGTNPTNGAQPGTLGAAGGNQQRPKAPDALFGDWGGLRTKLSDAGVKFTIGYKGEAAGNVSGGERHYATETGQLAITGALDMEKIAGIHGGTIQGTVTYRHGHDLGERAGLGVLQQVQEVYGRGQTWRLTELWYQQELADGALVLKAGRMPAGEFNTFDCDFMNLTWCGAPAGNITGTYWYNYPIAQWTGWAKIRHDAFYLKLGANEDNRNNLDNAFLVSRGGARGYILHAEIGWTPAFRGGKLPGRYQAGWWHTSGNDPDILADAQHEPFALSGLPAREAHGQYGIYVQGEQQVTGEATEDPISGAITRTRGLNLFFNVTRNDPTTATTLDQETIGLYYNAPFASRPQDHVGFGVGRTNYNRRAALAEYLVDPTLGRRKAEYAAELYYALNAIKGVVLRPNVQYVMDPGGRRDATDVVVIGGRFDINF